jgi:hypothetical protein
MDDFYVICYHVCFEIKLASEDCTFIMVYLE